MALHSSIPSCVSSFRISLSPDRLGAREAPSEQEFISEAGGPALVSGGLTETPLIQTSQSDLFHLPFLAYILHKDSDLTIKTGLMPIIAKVGSRPAKGLKCVYVCGTSCYRTDAS